MKIVLIAVFLLAGGSETPEIEVAVFDSVEACVYFEAKLLVSQVAWSACTDYVE